MTLRRLFRSRPARFAAGLVAATVLLAACSQMPRARSPESATLSAAPAAAPAPAQLGTQWGEGLESRTRTVVTRRSPPRKSTCTLLSTLRCTRLPSSSRTTFCSMSRVACAG